ncbi:cell division protein Cdc14 [Sphaerosporella brunnea]|uniref:Cell division protein Cdc14 n=1 Tax=Sphaerosporella brunnea TaxID=1250544 RepID=A0A5J5ETF6_9PEZI|nr:cell division protein Cdc14 [Sphaerosporella brunnea]
MESLLSSSFDLLSSYDTPCIKKGLRYLEGFLAKMCLQTAPSAPKNNGARRDSLIQMPAAPVASRPRDAAFREFLRLQNGFEWNITIRLIACLERLLGKENNEQNNRLILASLDLIQGMLLLHPPSRKLFAREIHMNVMLDLLDAGNTADVQSATLLTLVCALIDHPANTRVFEALDGLATITSLFKRRDTPREVKLKILEFLYFYLMDETPKACPAPEGGVPAKIKQNKTTEEKQAMLAEYMANVDNLVADLKESQPFGM